MNELNEILRLAGLPVQTVIESKAEPLQENKDPAIVLKQLEEVAAKLKVVEAALSEARAAGSKLPSLFRQHIHAGNVHNLDHPKEYAIWVGLENLKDLYSLSKAMRETVEGLASTKSKLKGYK